MSTNLLIVDDHEVVRSGLKTFFGKPEFTVAEASGGREALKLLKKRRANVVLLDVRMPGGDGLECLARIKSDFAKTHVVMFSAYDNPTYVARSLALGASAYLSKNARREQIKSAVRAAAAGEMLWSKEQLRRVSGSLLPLQEGTPEIALTKRENEVLKQIALGLTNKEIAKALGISFETIKEHVQHVLQKLGVNDRTQAAVWAVRQQLV